MSTKSKTFYRKAHSLLSAFDEHDRRAPFIWGGKWSVTEKMDGTQLGIEMNRSDDDYTFSLRTHGGNPCFDQSIDMTREKLVSGTYSYQKASLTDLLPSALDSFAGVMKEMGLTKSYFYCEVTLPGKTPCKLPYPDELKSRVWFFNHVYSEKDDWTGEDDDCIKVSVTQDTMPLFEKHGVPCVPILLSGDSFSEQDYDSILVWCDDNPDREGIIFHQPDGRLLKIKTHHAMSLIKPKPNFSSDVLDRAHATYMEHLSSSEVVKVKRDRQARRESSRLGLTNDQINDEIAKEFTHESHDELLVKYQAEADRNVKQQILGMSDLRKAVMASLIELHGEDKVKKSKRNILSLIGVHLSTQSPST